MDPASIYHEWFENLEKFTDRQVRGAVITPAEVARAVVGILRAKRPRVRYLIGRRAILLLNLRRYLPGEFFDRIWMRAITRRITGAEQ